jgi:hypothetical protein
MGSDVRVDGWVPVRTAAGSARSGHTDRTTTEGEAMTSTLTRPELTASDRCDRCSAAARVRAVLPSGGELLFCNHHAREHSSKLKELAADIQASEV